MSNRFKATADVTPHEMALMRMELCIAEVPIRTYGGGLDHINSIFTAWVTLKLEQFEALHSQNPAAYPTLGDYLRRPGGPIEERKHNAKLPPAAAAGDDQGVAAAIAAAAECPHSEIEIIYNAAGSGRKCKKCGTVNMG